MAQALNEMLPIEAVAVCFGGSVRVGSVGLVRFWLGFGLVWFGKRGWLVKNMG